MDYDGMLEWVRDFVRHIPYGFWHIWIHCDHHRQLQCIGRIRRLVMRRQFQLDVSGISVDGLLTSSYQVWLTLTLFDLRYFKSKECGDEALHVCLEPASNFACFVLCCM